MSGGLSGFSDGVQVRSSSGPRLEGRLVIGEALAFDALQRERGAVNILEAEF